MEAAEDLSERLRKV